MTPETLASVIGALTAVSGAVIGVMASLFAARLQARRVRGTEGETLEHRVNRLTTSLSDAARVIEEIETEIQDRRRTVDRLQQDIETYQRLREVNQEELEAVAQVLGGELRREGRRSFWVNFATNFAFFVAGAIVSVITTLIIGS